tara:strand:- start:1129 stop:2169 length:1041 start_codon:yes stop_codon:yes gene_type:complete
LISTKTYNIRFKDDGYYSLENLVSDKSYSKLFVIVDENSKKHCLSKLNNKVSLKLKTVEIKSGEINKNINTCFEVWNLLTKLEADRRSLIINLGGGVITDMGGFIASTFKRGIDFVNIPTTLLSMVDASVGSKTGINFNLIKNQIGLFSDPKLVIIDADFLITLPKREIASGYAEIYKHSIISNENFEELTKNENLIYSDDLIKNSIKLKNEVVKKDKHENNIRKSLNFGHTIGHAIESVFLAKKNKLLHGEAIAIGMICESFISSKTSSFEIKKSDEIKKHLKNIFQEISFSQDDIKNILNLIKFDKKNELNKPKFALISQIGKVKLDVEIDDSLIIESLKYYSQ